MPESRGQWRSIERTGPFPMDRWAGGVVGNDTQDIADAINVGQHGPGLVWIVGSDHGFGHGAVLANSDAHGRQIGIWIRGVQMLVHSAIYNKIQADAPLGLSLKGE